MTKNKIWRKIEFKLRKEQLHKDYIAGKLSFKEYNRLLEEARKKYLKK